MKDIYSFEKDLKNTRESIRDLIEKKLPTKIKGLALENISDNFSSQSFDGDKWKPRKTTDKNGKDLTTFKRNRGKHKKGDLTAFGRQNKNRAILIGFKNPDKMSRSFFAQVGKATVTIYNKKIYTIYHQHGKDRLPSRKMYGINKTLKTKIDNAIKNLTKQQ